MTTRDETVASVASADAAALRARIAGEVLLPDDEGYDESRRVWNARIDRWPALVVRPRTAQDVVEAVRFARAGDLPIAVRGGGHGPAGHSTVDDGLLVHLAHLTDLELDPANRVAWAGAGLTWGEYTARAQEHGLATPGGDVAAVGLSGLSLAGGMGWLMRRYGLTVDNVLAVELVTADGRVLTASDEEHPDLFWALRGGGGNVGVATRFRYRLNPVGAVLGGAIVHAATFRELRAYADVTRETPDELTTISFVLKAPPLPFLPTAVHGRLVHLIVPCWVGDPDAGERALRPFRKLAGQEPLADTTGPTTYSSLFALTDMAAARRAHAVRNAYLRELPDEVIAAVLEAVGSVTSPFALVGLRELGGAVARVPGDATAFAHRDKAFYLTVDNAWEPDDAPEPHVAWTDELWAAVAPAIDGAYVGYLADDAEDRVLDAYPAATYARLADVKRSYDPQNVFRGNVNVRPAEPRA